MRGNSITWALGARDDERLAFDRFCYKSSKHKLGRSKTITLNRATTSKISLFA